MMRRKIVLGLVLVLSGILVSCPVSSASSSGTIASAPHDADDNPGLANLNEKGNLEPDYLDEKGNVEPEVQPEQPGTGSQAAVADDDDAAPPPQSPLKVDISTYYLYTRAFAGGNEPEIINADNDTIVKSKFQARAKTYFILHGFASRASTPWIIDLKDKILERDSGSNVVTVEWTTEFGTNYSEKIYNETLQFIPALGASMARLIDVLHKVKNLPYEDVHAIGFNLGAHIAGFAGKKSLGPIGRITGLEPASKGYLNEPASSRLDSTDAHYVDIMHTNSCNNWNEWDDCFGIHQSIGHTDFWPNGGFFQPACKNKKKKKNVMRCDHKIVTQYFVESFMYSNSDTRFLARPAKNYNAYNRGSVTCGAVAQYMGILADPRSQGDYFLNTSASAPYALLDPKCPSGKHQELLNDAAIAGIVIAVLFVVFAILIFVIYKVKGIWKKNSDGATDPLLGPENDDRTNRIIDGEEQPRGSSILAGVARGFSDLVNRPVDV